MAELRNLYWRQLEDRLGGLASELTRLCSSTRQAREAWHPAINACHCRDCILICAELAGVDRSQITVTVEARRVGLRGQRVAPESRAPEGPSLRVLAMEIDHGAFER